MKELPDTPSELIQLALDDLAKVEQNPHFCVDMNTWLRVRSDGICSVCLAGAVMAQSLGYVSDKMLIGLEGVSNYYFESVESKLLALDNFRKGCIVEGLCDMGYDPSMIHQKDLDDFNVTRYDSDSAKFRRDMEYIVELLKSKGL